tara:strand:+ start:33021 stop:34292 length:1272 start_codon:yes stop_codon:yes gene_type:complete
MTKKIIGLLTLLISLNTIAQKNNTSPYSFFGVGDYSINKTVEEISMGEVSGAFNSQFQLSFANPASFASLRLTTYALAGENKSLQINDGISKQSGSSASFSYLALGFPVGDNAGVVFGIQPNTTVGYSLLQRFTDTNGDLTEINSFTGEGGTNRVFLGFGHKVGANFNLGAEASYVFGSIENNLLNRRNGVPLATLQTSSSDISGIAFKVGAQYQKKVSEKLTLRTGVTLNLNNELTNKGTELRVSTLNVEDPLPFNYRDTTLIRSFDALIKNPLKTTLSAGIGEINKWYAGVEYSFQNAIDFDDELTNNNNTYGYTESNRVSIGGFYTPKFNSISNYWQRATYRAGLSYKQTGLMVNSTEVNDFGISFGVGLPMGKQLSTINLGFELGKRGETSNGLVKENYFNFRVGLSLSDKWFNKRQLD